MLRSPTFYEPPQAAPITSPNTSDEETTPRLGHFSSRSPVSSLDPQGPLPWAQATAMDLDGPAPRAEAAPQHGLGLGFVTADFANVQPPRAAREGLLFATVPASPQPLSPPNDAWHHCLSMGNHCFKIEGAAAGRASQHWRNALLVAPDHAYATLGHQVPQQTDEFGLALHELHMAIYAPTAQLAREHAIEAVETEALLADALASLLNTLAAAGDSVHGQLHRRLSAFTPRNYAAQLQLESHLFAGDFAESARMAIELQQRLPHLLLPRIAGVIAELLRDDTATNPSSLAFVHDAFATLSYVVGLNGEQHMEARGTQSLDHYRAVWQVFLEKCYQLEPTAFGAQYHSFTGLAPQPITQRRVAGLPWNQALQLPLPCRWVDVPRDDSLPEAFVRQCQIQANLYRQLLAQTSLDGAWLPQRDHAPRS